MRVFGTLEEARQHIEASLRGLAKSALERAQDSRRRFEAETDARLKEIWRLEAEAEKRIAKAINDECEALLKRLAAD